MVKNKMWNHKKLASNNYLLNEYKDLIKNQIGHIEVKNIIVEFKTSVDG